MSATEPPRTQAPGEATTRAVLRALTVVAPVTLLTALAYYFGWTATHASADYLGIDESLLGFSTQDYVLRSVRAIFWPLCIGLVLGALALKGHGVLTEWTQVATPGTRSRRVLAVVVALGCLGVLLLLYGVLALQQAWLYRGFSLAPLAMTLAVAVVAYALTMHAQARRGGTPAAGQGPPLTVLLISLLVAVGLFWQVAEWATAVGVGATQSLVANLGSRPVVTVYSASDLALGGPGIAAVRLPDPEGAYRYRYTGLRLLFRADGRYFLLSDPWSRTGGRLYVVDESASVRFEFAPGRSP